MSYAQQTGPTTATATHQRGGRPLQKKANRSGLPHQLKAGIEHLSGYAMDDVQVHYNSPKPAQLQAHAYAQGTDIHLAPGQEQHLPHEAWHVVQQKQGRVKPSLQLKGTLINDNTTLEREADQMGEKAEGLNSDVLSSLQGSYRQLTSKQSNDTVQRAKKKKRNRKRNFKKSEKQKVNITRNRLVTLLKEFRDNRIAAFNEDEQETFDSINGQEYSKLSKEQKRVAPFTLKNMDINSFVDSLLKEVNEENKRFDPYGYGHLASLYYRIWAIHQKEDQEEEDQKNKSEEKNKEKDFLEEKQKLAESLAKEDDRYTKVIPKRKDNEPQEAAEEGPMKEGELLERLIDFYNKRIFNTAILGTGASVAYYINANRKFLNPPQTVIIGNVQPWDPEGKDTRGINFINHPMYMTSPDRSKAHLDGEEAEEFKGNPEKLTKQINETLKQFKNLKNAEINKVKRDDSVYHIETDEGTYYAKNVVVGLGIGPHSFKNDQIGKNEKSIIRDNEIIIKNEGEGEPNVDDSLKDELSKEAAAKLLNKAKNVEKERVMDLDAFQRRLHKEDGLEGSELTIGIVGPNAGVDAAYTASKSGKVNKVIWAVSSGPAIADGMANNMKDKQKEKITLHFMRGNGWTIARGGAEDELTGKINMKLSGRDWEWEGLKEATEEEWKGEGFKIGEDGGNEEVEVKVDYLVIAAGPDVTKIKNIFDKNVGDLTTVPDISGYFGMPGEAPDAGTILANEDNSLKVIGGAAARLQKREERGKFDSVINTLFSPTVVMNDQLAPIRSQIEADADYTPEYLGKKGEINSLADNQNTLRKYIELFYRNIPPKYADWLTQQIIIDRNYRDKEPGKRGKAFQEKWLDKLKGDNEYFKQNTEEGESKIPSKGEVEEGIKLIVYKTIEALVNPFERNRKGVAETAFKHIHFIFWVIDFKYYEVGIDGIERIKDEAESKLKNKIKKHQDDVDSKEDKSDEISKSLSSGLEELVGAYVASIEAMGKKEEERRRKEQEEQEERE